MTVWEYGKLVIHEPPNVIATSDTENLRYMRVVLREDQLDLIRQIVREEIARAKE